MAENFDLFVFEHCDSMLNVLSDPDITVVDDGGQLVADYPDPPGDSCDLGILSGEEGAPSFPEVQTLIRMSPDDGVGTRWTAEWSVTFESLPEDFQGLIDEDLGAPHVYFGASDATGPCAGVFVSQAGLAFSGSLLLGAEPIPFALPAGPLVPIPGSSQFVELGVQTTIRLVVDGLESVAYLYVTPTSDVMVSGHRLVAIFVPFAAADMSQAPTDCSMISADGSEELPSRIAVDAWRMSSELLIPNTPPVADAGTDQAVRFCSIAQLDGTASFDPEGLELTYAWRLIGAPFQSVYSVTGNDGRTLPLGPPTGFTNKFHSVSLGLAHAADELDAGDVLLVDAIAYDIVSTGTDGDGFHVVISGELLPEPSSAKSFRVFRQRGISGATTSKPTFLADVLGFYRFDLVVNDGDLDSLISSVVINVVDSPLPRGVIPDARFVFDYLSDYWSLLEDRGPLDEVYSAMAQVVASELYTLWQHDYGKSLRDIQRTFLRRWLHYDLLLAEPIPELTTMRLLYGGVTTNLLARTAGDTLNGTSFRIASAFHATTTITIISPNPVVPGVAQLEVRNRLLELDPRYTVDIQTRLFGSDFFDRLRINAPFPFTITNATGVLFVNGVNGNPTGTGTALSTRSFSLGGNTGLVGLDVREDDLLIIGGEAYRIQQVVRDSDLEIGDAADQVIVVKDDLPVTGAPVSFTLSGWVRSELLDFYNGLLSNGDALFFEVVASQEGDESFLAEAVALGVTEAQPSQLGFTITSDIGSAIADPDRWTVRLAKTLRRTYLPIHEDIVDIPTLTEHIVIEDDQATLRRNLDFFIEEFRGYHCLRFQSDSPDVWEGENPPDRVWAEYTYVDNRPTIEDNFGIPAEVSVEQIEALPGNVDYLSAVRGIWYAYINGPTMFNLRVGAQILLGLPFAEEAGTIEEIRTDFSAKVGRILIRDTERSEIVRSYTFPRSLALEVNPATGELYAVGDAVTQFAPLVKGVEVIDYVSDPTWFQGLLNQGIFYEIEKYFKFLVRVDSAAFNIDSLSFVREFMLKIKPSTSYPFFLVTVDLGDDTDISVTDDLRANVTVRLLDTVCGGLTPFSTSFDDPRLSGGGFWNQFDTDSDDGTAPPAFDTSDAVEWGFDRYVLCPEDALESHTTQIFSGSALASTGLNFVDSEDLYNVARFMESGPFVVANGATGEAITAETGATVPDAGTVDRVRVLISGGPGSDPAAYEVVVAINGVDEITQGFTSVARYTDVSFVVSEAVIATDVITARVRHAGGAPRSPAWTHVRIEVYVNLGAWVGGDLLAAGNYGFNRTLA
jgi:hypothetical protein